MRRTRMMTLGLSALLLAGCGRPAAGPYAAEIQGDWEIVSVRRDGEPDPTHVGARMTFDGNHVSFLPHAVEFVGAVG